MKFELPVDLTEWIENMWPMLEKKQVNKVEASLSNCEAQMYWAGTIIRIDLKPIKST
jgi:hypothetical protein